MSLEVATVVEDAVEYSFALEYHGPPITRELPRAVPINVDRIPVAAVVSPLPFSDSLSLPVVQPISAADIIGKKLSKDLKLSSSSAELLIVSPTSVIAFESQNNEVSEGSYSKELGLGTETSVSPSSVNDALADREPEIRNSNDICALSGELSSDFECCNRDDGLNGVNERGYSSISHDHSCEFVGGVGSSGALGSSDSFEKSRDFSGSLRKSRLSNAYKESLDFNESNRTDWESNESDYLSSRVSSHKFGDGNAESGGDVRRAPVVTFCDIESDDETFNEDFSRSEPEVVRMKKEPAAKVKKGACYRCLKGNRFTEEVCMVCDAKYCTNCVLRTMGSMPEGRKFVTCIGYPINEPKRGSLGKCSRMLKRLLNDLEVKQIMKAEKFCEVNQLPPEYICVNGRPLYHDELVMLQSCPNPPKKLKPGNYWYDKVSGLWGKEGQKPSQIISPHLNVGGSVKADSSNGNTQVYINGREITKVELRMLKARILYKDIPFSEEEREHIKSVIQSHVYNYMGILLEGRERFEEESLNELRRNQSCDGTTLEGQVDSNDEETPYSICPRLKAFSDWLLKIMASGTLEAIFPAASREYAPLVEELCSSASFQATYKWRKELEALPSISSYFLEQAVEILKPDYRPSDLDILYAEHVTSSNGLSCVEFSFPEPVCDGDADSGDLHDSLLRYQLIRLQAKGFGENCKWLEMLEDVRIVIFCVSLSDYDQFADDGDGNTVNKMLLSKKFFENMVTHPSFDQMEFLLLLNKYDLFEEKIEQVPLSKCDWFDDFHPVISRNRSSSNSANHPTLGQLGSHYVAVKFKRLYSSLTGRKLYVSSVKGLEPNSVDAALKYAREVLNWDDSLSEYSIYSTEASSFSH